MDRLTKYLVESILKEDKKIKKIVGIYGGRFQPFGPHHLKTYKWLQSRVDEAYITTSNIKKPPRHPMNFKEKVRHMTKMGVKSKYIIEEKSPYVAKNLAKKYDEETTAFVYVFGAKDAGRLGGGGKYFQDFLKNKKNLKGHGENGYYLVAPHVSIKVGGKEVSGTVMRELLGSPKIDDSDREKLFKKAFGYFDKGLYLMMTNKFKKLFESDWKKTRPKPISKKNFDGEGRDLLKDVVSSSQLVQVEKYLDKLWGKVGIDVEFTRHFMDRANDKRNEKPITSAEVLRIFKQTYKKYGKQIPKLGDDAEALMKDMRTDVNVPFALHWNGKELELRAKTIMRKKNFKSSNKKFAVEGVELPIKVGDTIMMGRFKNKKVVIKSIEFNDKGDLLINNRPAVKFRIPKQTNVTDEQIIDFLATIDMKKVIEEASSLIGGGLEVDDGPRGFYGDRKTYEKRNKDLAGKMGMDVLNLLVDEKFQLFDPFNDEYPNGPVGDVSFAPTGIADKNPENRRERNHFTGSRAFGAYFKHINRVAEILGFEIISYLDADKVAQQSLKTKEMYKERPEETDEKRKDVVDAPKGKKGVGDGMTGVKESLFSKHWWKDILVEGGAYGHMAHPFDDKDLTFGDLKKIIELGLGGQLSREDNVTEKLDGQNLMVSWINGKLRVARNKGHIKNFGKTSLDAKGVKLKFAGRGDIADAFNFAVKDMSKAIKKLSQKQKDKVFNEGQHWMNLEVMYPKSANVIDYDVAQIVFHGALKYDERANVIGEVPDSGRMLAGMIKQINQDIQKYYKITKPVFLQVPKHQDFGKMKKKFLTTLDKLKKTYNLNDNDTLALYHQKWWESFILKKNSKVSSKVLEGLVRRWAFFEKKYSVANMRKDIKDEKFLEWVLKYDKENHAKQVKENMRPFEVLFFEVGAEILKNVEGFIAVNPSKTAQSLRKDVKKAISDLKSGGDIKKMERFKTQLDRFEAIGGAKAVVPSEGLVFKYQGKTYKFTGAFAPINQIMGLINF